MRAYLAALSIVSASARGLHGHAKHRCGPGGPHPHPWPTHGSWIAPSDSESWTETISQGSYSVNYAWTYSESPVDPYAESPAMLTSGTDMDRLAQIDSSTATDITTDTGTATGFADNYGPSTTEELVLSSEPIPFSSSTDAISPARTEEPSFTSAGVLLPSSMDVVPLMSIDAISSSVDTGAVTVAPPVPVIYTAHVTVTATAEPITIHQQKRQTKKDQILTFAEWRAMVTSDYNLKIPEIPAQAQELYPSGPLNDAYPGESNEQAWIDYIEYLRSYSPEPPGSWNDKFPNLPNDQAWNTYLDTLIHGYPNLGDLDFYTYAAPTESVTNLESFPSFTNGIPVPADATDLTSSSGVVFPTMSAINESASAVEPTSASQLLSTFASDEPPVFLETSMTDVASSATVSATSAETSLDTSGLDPALDFSDYPTDMSSSTATSSAVDAATSALNTSDSSLDFDDYPTETSSMTEASSTLTGTPTSFDTSGLDSSFDFDDYPTTDLSATAVTPSATTTTSFDTSGLDSSLYFDDYPTTDLSVTTVSPSAASTTSFDTSGLDSSLNFDDYPTTDLSATATSSSTTTWASNPLGINGLDPDLGWDGYPISWFPTVAPSTTADTTSTSSTDASFIAVSPAGSDFPTSDSDAPTDVATTESSLSTVDSSSASGTLTSDAEAPTDTSTETPTSDVSAPTEGSDLPSGSMPGGPLVGVGGVLPPMILRRKLEAEQPQVTPQQVKRAKFTTW